MRRELLLIVSIGLNVALMVALLAGRKQSPATTPAGGLQAAGTNKVHTEVVVRKQFFSWREVESADYPAYIENLRGIGCPEQTVRDIIVADVNQLYGKKRAEDIGTPEQQWWRAQPDTNFVQTVKLKMDALETERRALLTTLLGTNWDAPYPSSTRPVVALNGPVLGELPPATKESVQEITAKLQQRIKEYLDARQPAGAAPDPAEIARLRKQFRDELARVLNPAQMEEFLLRYSQTATDLRNQIKGFDVTPDEFRAMFRSRDVIEQQTPAITGDAAAIASQQAALQIKLDEAVKTVLGARRYEELLLSQDPAYRAAVAAAQDAGASPDAVQKLYQLNKVVQQEQDRIRNDPALSPEEKNARLANLDQQQQTVGDQILGLVPPQPPPLPVPQTPLAIHPFSPGETVDMIAARYGVSANSILNANPNVDFNQLQRGTQITIPKKPEQ